MNPKVIAAIVFVVILAAAGAVVFRSQSRQKKISPQNKNITIDQSKKMKITSPVFENNANIPSKFTCDGENVNPELTASDVPAEAKSLAMIMDDPDAPRPGGFVHWVLFNFDPRFSEIAENSVPANAIQGQNGAGQSSYTGPCPPSGTHRYFFKLYALDSMLALDPSAKREDVEQAMEGHILDQAELIGLYKRP